MMHWILICFYRVLQCKTLIRLKSRVAKLVITDTFIYSTTNTQNHILAHIGTNIPSDTKAQAYTHLQNLYQCYSEYKVRHFGQRIPLWNINKFIIVSLSLSLSSTLWPLHCLFISIDIYVSISLLSVFSFLNIYLPRTIFGFII